MKPWATAAAALAFALLTYFQFPGHTYLQQDTQIYVPILEHLRDPAVLRNDILTEQPHVAFTLYDEAARFLRAVTGLGFREVLGFEQIVTRALGIWGLYLMATALGSMDAVKKWRAGGTAGATTEGPTVSATGEAAAPVSPACGRLSGARLGGAAAALVAAIVSLGARIPGPEVLVWEYEPTPRAFAVPLLICGIGLAAHRRYLAAGVAGAAAFLYHPPTAIPFWAIFVVILTLRRKAAGIGVFAAAVLILTAAAAAQAGSAETQTFFSRLTPFQEQLQRTRTAYVWVSTWPAGLIPHYLMLSAILAGAFLRIRREIPRDLGLFLLGLPALGMASLPLSWLLLERCRWALIPQVQPMRALLFVALSMQFLTAAAGVHAIHRRRSWEAWGWFALAYLLPLHTVTTVALPWRAAALIAALGALTVAAARIDWPLATVVAVAACFAIPLVGGVVNYPRLHTPELAQLSEWARSGTGQDSVFLFADAGRALDPGIFRSEALRAVYVDWKGGGQVNYLRVFGEQWWFRWQQTMARGFRSEDVPKYSGLGITHIVLRAPHRLARPPAFENRAYAVYSVP